MQDPVRDIEDVIRDLYAAESPDVQRDTVYKYYIPLASFRGPLGRVDRGTLSRESILGIYQWYRILSPHVSVHVNNKVYDKPNNTLFLDISQVFNLSFSPLNPAPSRMLVRLSLQTEDGVYRIAVQEEYFHPEDLTALVFPPLASLAGFTLRAFGIFSNICAKMSQAFGYWRPEGTGIAYDNESKEQKVNVSQKAGDHENDRGPKLGKKAVQKKGKTVMAATASNAHQATDVGGNQPRYEYGQNL